MQTIVFTKDINVENITDLISEIEEKNKENEDNNINIYFSTGGGCVSSGNVLIDYISNSKVNITLITNWSVNSVGFDILYLSKCNKKILNCTHSLLHLKSRDINTNDIKSNIYDKFLLKDVDEGNKEYIKMCNKFLTIKEIDILKKGENIILDYKRLKKIIK